MPSLFSYNCLHNALKEMKYLYNQMDINAVVNIVIKHLYFEKNKMMDFMNRS